MTTRPGKLFVGLPMWANPDWRGSLYGAHMPMADSLAEYSRVFSAVEGNTTFYSGTPAAQTIRKWRDNTPPDFRFCFKLPQSITHQARLNDISGRLDEFLDALSILMSRLGPIMIQLPRDFGAQELSRLETLLKHWPREIPVSVEPRDPVLFAKGEVEKNFNQLLITYNTQRVMLDTRALFSTASDNNKGLAQAQSEKPRRPLHVISTGLYPIIRFIGHSDNTINNERFTPWIERLRLWISQGKSPYLFVHTPDNREAPGLASALLQRLGQDLDPTIEWVRLPSFPGEQQTALF